MIFSKMLCADLHLFGESATPAGGAAGTAGFAGDGGTQHGSGEKNGVSVQDAAKNSAAGSKANNDANANASRRGSAADGAKSDELRMQRMAKGEPASPERAKGELISPGSAIKSDRGSRDVAERRSGETAQTIDPSSQKRAYDEFIRQNKEIDEKRIQSIIDKRFKSAKMLENAVEKSRPILNMLMQKYNVEGFDMDKLQKAMEEDEHFKTYAGLQSRSAAKDGASDLRRESEVSRAAAIQKAAFINASMNKRLMGWGKEAHGLKGKYPAFDLGREAKNPQFTAMLRSGLPMEQAYNALHMEEILQDARHNAARDTERRVVSQVRAKGIRPKENGIASGSSFIVREDVSRLTPKERADAVRRSQMGETVTFGR